jgi:hypothetical protein
MVSRRRECLNPQCLDANGNRYRFTSHERLSPQSAVELAKLETKAANAQNQKNATAPQPPISASLGPPGLSAKQAGVSARRPK